MSNDKTDKLAGLPPEVRAMAGGLEMVGKAMERPRAQHTPQHTPGPWRVEQVQNVTVVVALRDNEVCFCPVGRGREHNVCLDESRINARLIAAAPELLEALKQLSIIIDAGGDFQIGPKGRHSTLRESLHKLIAKAEGKAEGRTP